MAVLTWLRDNPVATKELRSRMRGVKAYWILFAYLTILSTVIFIAYFMWYSSHQSFSTSTTASISRTFFNIIFYTQASLITLILPALVSGSITIEREQKTFEMVQCSALFPKDIVMGKLISSLSYVVMLLTCSLPLVSISFLLGGVSPDEIFITYAMLVVDAFLFCAIGITWSIYTPNTAVSTIATYLSILLFAFVSLPFAVDSGSNRCFSALSPFGSVNSALIMEKFYSLILHAYVPASILKLTLGLLLCMAAMNRLEDYPPRKALYIRLFILVFISEILYFVYGAISAQTPPTHIYVYFIGLATLFIFGTITATGDRNQYEFPDEHINRIITLNPITALRYARLNCAPLFSFLCSAIIAAITVMVIKSSSGVTPSVELWNTSFIVLGFGITLMVVGIGYLISINIHNHFASMIITFSIIAFICLIPLIYISSYPWYEATKSINMNWIYLTPASTISDVATGIYVKQYKSLFFYNKVPAYIVTSAIYSFIGAVCLTISYWTKRKQLTRQPLLSNE